MSRLRATYTVRVSTVRTRHASARHSSLIILPESVFRTENTAVRVVVPALVKMAITMTHQRGCRVGTPGTLLVLFTVSELVDAAQAAPFPDTVRFVALTASTVG